MNKQGHLPLKNSFKDFSEFVSLQFTIPQGQLSFWAFLLIGIVGAGGYGVWVELYRWNASTSTTNNLSGVILAVFTYYPALAGASIFQLIFHSEKYVRSGFTVIGVTIYLLTFIFFPSPGSFSISNLLIGLTLAFISILIWWIANGADATYHDNPNPNSSTGGDISNELQGSGLVEQNKKQGMTV